MWQPSAFSVLQRTCQYCQLDWEGKFSLNLVRSVVVVIFGIVVGSLGFRMNETGQGFCVTTAASGQNSNPDFLLHKQNTIFKQCKLVVGCQGCLCSIIGTQWRSLSVVSHFIFFSICFVCLVFIFTASQRLQGILSEAGTLVLATYLTLLPILHSAFLKSVVRLGLCTCRGSLQPQFGSWEETENIPHVPEEHLGTCSAFCFPSPLAAAWYPSGWRMTSSCCPSLLLCHCTL